MESYKCEACAKSFTGLVCFQQHEASEKHKRKARLINVVTFESPKSIKPDQFHCPVCMVSISGLDNYQKHVISLDHALKVQKKNGDLLSQSVSDTFELKAERNLLMESTGSLTSASPIKIVPPYAECKPCQKQFSGPEPYQQHLVSAGHKKKCALNEITLSHEMDISARNEKINDDSLHDAPSSSTGCYQPSQLLSFARCDICMMQFSGPLPYQAHLVSDGHKKKAGGNSLAESQNASKCDLCIMIFTGPVPYQQHLASIGHKKRMNATSESLSRPDSTLNDNNTIFGQSSMNETKWYCDVCKKQCSGPIPYNSHLSSQNHSKNLRVREIEDNLRKAKESGPLSLVGNHEIDSSVPSQVTFADLKTNEMKESNIELNINDLNINARSDTKILSDKFQVNANDLIALTNLNIIPPEKLDVAVFGSNDEVVFSSPKKYKLEMESEMNEVLKVFNS